MQLSVSQQLFIGSVRNAIHKYDAQLKDINNKVSLTAITTVVLANRFRSGRIRN